MKRFIFDSIDNTDYYAFELENAYIRVVILEYGGIIQSFVDKKSGIDIVHGYANVSDYFNDQDTYTGAVVGRYCNRIEKGKFALNDQEYHLCGNNNGNTLHGGKIGFNQKLFHSTIDNNQLKLTYCSPHLEEGFPGELQLCVIYEIVQNELIFTYTVFAEEDTIFNITNHSYFSLANGDYINNHDMKILADEIACIDAFGQTMDKKLNVENTPFDFREYKLLEIALNDEHEQIKFAGGIDHHFCVRGEGLRKFLECKYYPLTLEITSDLPGFHFYTGNYLKSFMGKSNTVYKPRTGFCVETQFYPNNINNNQFPKSILKAGERQTFQTRYKVTNQEENYEN